MKYFLAMTFTAKSCSLWIGRLLTGQVVVFKFICYESSSRTFKNLHVQKQFPVLLIRSSLLKYCFFSASNVYLKKITPFFHTLMSSCWNWVQYFLINPSVKQSSHNQSTNINGDIRDFKAVPIFRKVQKF